MRDREVKVLLGDYPPGTIATYTCGSRVWASRLRRICGVTIGDVFIGFIVGTPISPVTNSPQEPTP